MIYKKSNKTDKTGGRGVQEGATVRLQILQRRRKRRAKPSHFLIK